MDYRRVKKFIEIKGKIFKLNIEEKNIRNGVLITEEKERVIYLAFIVNQDNKDILINVKVKIQYSVTLEVILNNLVDKEINLKALIYKPNKKEYYLLQNIDDIKEIQKEEDEF